MNRFIFVYLVAFIACGCNNSNISISGRFIGTESAMLYLESVESVESTIIDSVKLDNEGRFTLTFTPKAEEMSLYNIVSGGERIPLFLMGGDQVELSTLGNIAKGYRVEGSEESELLRQFYQTYIKGMSRLDIIANEYASTELGESERRDLARKYSTEYRAIKREQLRFIIENQSSLAAVYALYQRLPGDIYLFNGDNDVIYLRTVADALEETYPSSSYLKSLRNSISQMEKSLSLKANITTSNFPELKLPDMYGRTVELSSLLGKVILLEFWSSELGNSNTQNAELKELYTKYKDLGFEIYQVGIDTSKSHWISIVQEQRLPWISVCDFRGGASPSLNSYNVTKLPTNFVIDRSGTVIARDVRGEELEELITIELTK
ncbi:MAG: TlpA disulfide reductase family protein [Rikenellaceae bacterium]